MFKYFDVVRHEKTGTEYFIMGTPDRVKLEADGAPGYIYVAADNPAKSTLWVRNQIEMEDGRFTFVRNVA